jgi:hypothetical protein
MLRNQVTLGTNKEHIFVSTFGRSLEGRRLTTISVEGNRLFVLNRHADEINNRQGVRLVWTLFNDVPPHV